MRLAKVTIAGFKSFADSTEFRFDMPITGIVGPNGCGKSNVVDAIKWVLGDPAVTVVLAATRNPRHAAENLEAASGPVPDTSQRRAISEWFSRL